MSCRISESTLPALLSSRWRHHVSTVQSLTNSNHLSRKNFSLDAVRRLTLAPFPTPLHSCQLLVDVAASFLLLTDLRISCASHADSHPTSFGPLARLTRLRHLSLHDIGLGHEQIDAIKGMSSLTRLDLRGWYHRES